MAPTVTLSARVPEDLRSQVDTLAEALGRDRAWIVEQAVKRYLADEAEFMAAVKRGRADIAAGRFVEHDAVEAELDQVEAELIAQGRDGRRARPH
jgi:predicted transcriptional regulator